MPEIERLTATNLRDCSPGTRTNLLFTMSCRTGERPKPSANFFPVDEVPRPPSPGGKGWWSRTGSNRRPPACKAGALPAELRPLFLFSLKRRRRRPSPWLSRHEARRPVGLTDAFRVRGTNSSGAKLSKWWAWEDLNLRPHAYQARALTN